MQILYASLFAHFLFTPFISPPPVIQIKWPQIRILKLIASVFQEPFKICYQVQVFSMMCPYQNLTDIATQPGNARPLFFLLGYIY